MKSFDRSVSIASNWHIQPMRHKVGSGPMSILFDLLVLPAFVWALFSSERSPPLHTSPYLKGRLPLNTRMNRFIYLYHYPYGFPLKKGIREVNISFMDQKRLVLLTQDDSESTASLKEDGI